MWRGPVASVEPLVMSTPGKIVIKATMRTERSEEEAEGSVIRKMDVERRSLGTVVVGLGLRMLGTNEFGSWFKGAVCLLKHTVIIRVLRLQTHRQRREA
ncbi:hypothetical protein ACJRO7_005122 [Eucalyptus globulus]|uniref:Uncharacterized protein n=1 Tax=Eucalyptus globulus TaxID=34317 RepID=A0ABD3J0T1_EUCGL